MVQRISSVQNPLVKHLCHLRLNRDYREESRRVLIEGLKLIQEVCPHLPTYTLIAKDETLLPEGVQADQTVLVTEEVFNKISGMHTPEGVAAEVALPPYRSLEGIKRLLVLDGVNDPGNMGALLRTALALAWEGVYLLDEVCDPFNEKALRAAKGATFRLPLAHGDLAGLSALIRKNQLTPYAADIKGESLDAVERKHKIMLVLGNEAHGPSPEVKKICTPLTIPMSGSMESLNVAVAGGILMYELLKGKKNV